MITSQIIKTARDSDSHASQIQDLIEYWRKCILDEDKNRVLARVSNDVMMLGIPHELQLQKKIEYKKTWELFFSWKKESRNFEISNVKITASDTVAFCHGEGRCIGETEFGLQQSLQFEITMGFRNINGLWEITHEHHSLPI